MKKSSLSLFFTNKPWLQSLVWLQNRSWFSKEWWKSPKIIGGTLAAFIVLGSGGYYLANSSSAAYLIINGEKVGIVVNQLSGQNLIQTVLQEKGATLGVVAKTHDKIEFTPARVSKDQFQPLSEGELQDKLSTYIEAGEITIANQPIFILPSLEEAQGLLKSYQDIYTKTSDTNQVNEVSFEEQVETQSVEVTPDKVLTPEQALEKLKQGNIQKQEYTVQASDSWWLIARKNNMKTLEVLAANPGTTLDTKIKPGQKINLAKVTPFLTVVSKGTRIDQETIPFDVETKTDSSLGSDQTKVAQAGSDGQKEVKYIYVQKNDKIVSKSVIEEKVTKEAVKQVIAKGPKSTPMVVAFSRGSGQASGLGWPLNSHINSYYGYRWGGFHTGIDLAGDTGDPYVAAAAGKVVSAGWGGGYGNCIVIDHGNGIMTRYAHSSKMLVSAGQSVAKGQTIGLVGATGNATGPHLHFEVIINGDTVNPLNYLP
ncbi:peptidoglycan DD-metalloendopeptidase family protein [Desulfitobacterium sp.]|uniref:peptidoglycan DD-metalloendopeptidase family protein n=1 Tax=Desulfitobacterium sp. TaxID=49981 RepID=UPI002BC05F02|nr:peptidoglycan DD-metalloendopeptidase family protein [Desulfitobacterium sp.]HVJ48010.1 peptidoglycan DD-metalloendopeptidase family protein [Desulfitobacterium sp.]